MQVLQFEEGFGDSTHCALIKAPEHLRAGLVDKVVELARNLQTPSRKNPLGAFAVVSTDAGIFWVMNWEGSWKTNGKREIETKLEQIAVYKKPRPGNLAGLLLWVRPMQQYLKKRLEGKEVTYARPAAPKFYGKRPEQLKAPEKLEIMSEYMEECKLTGGIEDVLVFAQGFERLLGEYFQTDERLREKCIETFGQWAPNLRTKWYMDDKNMNLKKAHEPIQDWVQIPVIIRKKLTSRMLSKSQYVDGNIAEGMCLECGDKTEPGVGYCCVEHRAMNIAFTTCRCGSTNFEESRVTCPQNWPIEHLRGKVSITKICMGCRATVYVKPLDLFEGITLPGNKRSAAPDHVPLWTKRRKI